MKDAIITKNFKLSECFYSETAKKHKIYNGTDDSQILMNIAYTINTLQRIRDAVKAPIQITSMYRCRELNRLVGGHKNSWHIKGCAVDFMSHKVDMISLYRTIEYMHEAGIINVDRLLFETSARTRVQWLHMVVRYDSARGIFVDNYVAP